MAIIKDSVIPMKLPPKIRLRAKKNIEGKNVRFIKLGEDSVVIQRDIHSRL